MPLIGTICIPLTFSYLELCRLSLMSNLSCVKGEHPKPLQKSAWNKPASELDNRHGWGCSQGMWRIFLFDILEHCVKSHWHSWQATGKFSGWMENNSVLIKLIWGQRKFSYRKKQLFWCVFRALGNFRNGESFRKIYSFDVLTYMDVFIKKVQFYLFVF